MINTWEQIILCDSSAFGLKRRKKETKRKTTDDVIHGGTCLYSVEYQDEVEHNC